MDANVGAGDRVVRGMIGLVLLSLIFTFESRFRWLGLIGIVPLATAVFRYCPLYSVLGVNSLEHRTGGSFQKPR